MGWANVKGLDWPRCRARFLNWQNISRSSHGAEEKASQPARPTGEAAPGTNDQHTLERFVSWLGWEQLGIPLEKQNKVAGEREVWVSLMKLLPPRGKRKIMNGTQLILTQHHL